MGLMTDLQLVDLDLCVHLDDAAVEQVDRGIDGHLKKVTRVVRSLSFPT